MLRSISAGGADAAGEKNTWWIRRAMRCCGATCGTMSGGGALFQLSSASRAVDLKLMGSPEPSRSIRTDPSQPTPPGTPCPLCSVSTLLRLDAEGVGVGRKLRGVMQRYSEQA